MGTKQQENTPHGSFIKLMNRIVAEYKTRGYE
jgi:hypothetical protein